ncbi:MAG: methyltransferase domain-containing protein [Actinomycetota bacterium]
MDERAQLRAYYEREAELGTRGAMTGRRAALRTRVVDRLVAEHCASVIDVGAGPGSDAGEFTAVGLDYTAVDLAHANGRRARIAGYDFLQASAMSLPVRADAFDAAWSMSTLMHLAEPDAVRGVDELRRVVRPGGLCVLGIWGREHEERIEASNDVVGLPRTFYLRSLRRNREILTALGDVESVEHWTAASAEWDYQVFWVRTADPGG